MANRSYPDLAFEPVSPFVPWHLPLAGGGMTEVNAERWRGSQIVQLLAPAMRERDTPWDVVRGMVDIGKLPLDAAIYELGLHPEGTLIRYALFHAKAD